MIRQLNMSLLVVCSLAGVAPAQPQPQDGTYWKNSLSGEFASEVPTDSFSSKEFPNNHFGWGVNYSYRPLRWLKLETGLEQIPRPTGTIEIGDMDFFDAKDKLYLVPFGARYVWEPRTIPLQVEVGGGGAYLKHALGTEEYGFVASSSGWGGQFAGSVKYAFTRSKRFQLGLSFRYYIFSIKQAVTPPPNSIYFHAESRLVTLGPDFTFSF